eukprot:SAG11_NODE_501_length_8895_cov_12.129832_10_plen_158_part_00
MQSQVPSVQVREDLGTLKVSALKKRAKAAGASEAQLDEVDDADDTKAALISMVAELEAASAGPSLREELCTLKTSELKKRCKAAGVSEEQLDEADDADDTKAALIELVLALAAAPAPAGPSLREELGTLRTSELKKRAKAGGAICRTWMRDTLDINK